MQTALADFIKNSPAGREADGILRSCVHCGFCLPACPTYQLLGDELDSPRGRIYLMKQLLEGAAVSASTQLHLDRCLTCRACESACPSGVRYSKLLDIGRSLIEKRVPRDSVSAATRYLLRSTVPYTNRVRILVSAARAVRALLPPALRAVVPPSAPTRPNLPAPLWPPVRHARRVVLIEGCVQPVFEPNINAAAAQALDRLGISAVRASGCCGAVTHHLSAEEATLRQMRRNIDQLWPHVEAGVEAIVFAASACASMMGDYGRLLRDDAHYAERAARIDSLARDISQVLGAESSRVRTMLAKPRAVEGTHQLRVAFHAPCTLQHALKVSGVVEPLLIAAGYTLTRVSESAKCCGSAGTYSILQPELSEHLRRAKVAALEGGAPDVIATANIGCLTHLRSGASTPVCHWVELLAARLTDG